MQTETTEVATEYTIKASAREAELLLFLAASTVVFGPEHRDVSDTLGRIETSLRVSGVKEPRWLHRESYLRIHTGGQARCGIIGCDPK